MVKKITAKPNALSSSGHKLGQVIGDWWEIRVIYPLLLEVAESLNLFLDNRIVERICRSEKVQWADIDDNFVDYDFVFELGGTLTEKGIPVAFLESFWRRGARHSKDKARDDTNKLLPMRETYPTARFLAIAACGEFTSPAREYVRSRSVELLLIPKEKIIEAFKSIEITIDYPDNLPELEKNVLAYDLELKFTEEAQIVAAKNLKNIVGHSAFNSFKQRIESSLKAQPQEIRIYSLSKSEAVVFDCIAQASEFLISDTPIFPSDNSSIQYEYEVTFSDGTEFSRSVFSIDEARMINEQLLTLVNHISLL